MRVVQVHGHHAGQPGGAGAGAASGSPPPDGGTRHVPTVPGPLPGGHRPGWGQGEGQAAEVCAGNAQRNGCVSLMGGTCCVCNFCLLMC